MTSVYVSENCVWLLGIEYKIIMYRPLCYIPIDNALT